MYLTDNHTHTSFSYDAHFPIDEMCRHAIDAGLDEIAVTDHYDADDLADGSYPMFDAEGHFRAVTEAKERYASSLTVTYGIEIGQANHCPDDVTALLSKYPYDIVLTSIHNLEAAPDFAYLRYDLMPDGLIANLFHRYLNEQTEIAKMSVGNVLTHCTYPYRYMRRLGREFDFADYYDEYRALFRAVIESGKALEINTSTLTAAGITLPHPELLKLYRSLGGELISVGSDAHIPERVGEHLTTAYGILTDVGFRYITRYRDRKPECFPIA